jgi:beta-galactosidase
VPSFSSETYPGWLTHWKEKWAKPDTADLKKEMTYLLSHHKSFNLYVIHGGTNFGFTAGANAFSPVEYQPDLTSYDYDAPINEQGQPTPKYYLLRKLIMQYVKYKVPEVPKAAEAINIEPITLTPFTSIWQQLGKPFLSPQPQPMEYYGQNQGLMLYRTKLIGHKKGMLTITEPHDYAMVFLDGKFIDTIYRAGGKWSIKIPESGNKTPVLDILVEGMGHINFAQYMIDRKGITDRVTLNDMTLMDWQIYPLPMTEEFIKTLKPVQAANEGKGTFFKGSFDLQKTGDTYFDLSRYSKGIIYVNGHNLGRYWNTGPQQRLYCPASWLKKGQNEIIVFDFHQNKAETISGKTTLE